MKLEWTINGWQAMYYLAAAGILYWKVIRHVERFIMIFEEYPPHRHSEFDNLTITYPKRMRPNGN